MVQLGPELVHEKVPSKVLSALQKYETKVDWWLAHLTPKAASIASLQAENVYLMASCFWKTAFTCMKRIEEVHQQVLEKPEMNSFAMEAVVTEQLIWCDWLEGIGQAMLFFEDFDGKVHASLLPSIYDFLVASLHWWKTKISQAMRRIRSL